VSNDVTDRWDDADPRDDGYGRPGGDVIERAKAKVKGPAIGLIVVGVFLLIAAIMNSVQVATGGLDTQFEELRTKMRSDASKTQEQKDKAVEIVDLYEKITIPALPVYVGIFVIVGLLLIFGGIKMMNLKSRGLVMTSSILAMIPCFSSVCCLIGLPIGIWAIVVLSNPDVKAGYAAMSRSPSNY
jgi:hypothetical protein